MNNAGIQSRRTDRRTLDAKFEAIMAINFASNWYAITAAALPG
ncbi:hypothetical protein [Dankookia sp. P2]